MALKNKHWLLGASVVFLLVLGIGFFEPSGVLRGYLKGEKTFRNRPTTYWRRGLIDSDPAVQSRTLQSLEKGGPEAVPVLIELLQTEGRDDWEGGEVRRIAAEILGRFGPEARAAIPALVATLNDPDPHLRSVAALALGEIGPHTPEVCPALIGLLKTESRLSAVRALNRFGFEARAAVPSLIDLLQDSEPEVRWNAAQALGTIGPEARAAVPALIERLKDLDADVREHSAESLGLIGRDAEPAVAALIDTLQDKNARVRRDAARSLGQLGSAARPAIPALTQLKKDESDRVREAAIKSLHQIGNP